MENQAKAYGLEQHNCDILAYLSEIESHFRRVDSVPENAWVRTGRPFLPVDSPFFEQAVVLWTLCDWPI